MKPEGTRASEGRAYHVRVLDRAIAILGVLANRSEDLGDVELSEQLHLHKSTVHRLLAVLDRNGFVERKPGGAKYGLGWQLFELGMVAAMHLNLLDRAKRHVERLAKETGETAHMSVLVHGNVVSLVSAESQHSVRTPATIGRHTPLHCVSQGKAILAFLPAEQVEQVLTGYLFTPRTRNTITCKERFVAELALARERGYAIDNEEFEEGLRCIAAPLRDCSGIGLAAIGIAGPTYRIDGKRLPALSRVVMQVAADLSSAGSRTSP